jgi:hypothetical protein
VPRIILGFASRGPPVSIQVSPSAGFDPFRSYWHPARVLALSPELSPEPFQLWVVARARVLLGASQIDEDDTCPHLRGTAEQTSPETSVVPALYAVDPAADPAAEEEEHARVAMQEPDRVAVCFDLPEPEEE